MSRSVHARAPRYPRAAAVLAGLLLSACSVGVGPGLAEASGSLVEVSTGGKVGVGGKEVAGVNVPSAGGSAPALPQANVSVGAEPGKPLVGVSVGGQPVVEVPNPVTTTPQLPPVPPVETPSTPSLPTGAHSPTPGSTTATAATVGNAASGTRTLIPTGSSARSGQGAPKTAGATGRTGARALNAAKATAPNAATPTQALASKTAKLSSDRAQHRASASTNPLDAIGRNIPIPLPVPDWSKPIILLLLLIAAWFAVRSQLASRRARRSDAERAVLQRDVDVLQEALVPDVPAHLGGLAFSVAYRPAEGPAAGGDFYDVFETAPGKVAVVLGDVAGHGFDAVKHAALTRFTLRAYLLAGLEPRATLALASKTLSDHEDDLLATVAVGVYDSKSSTLTYSLAGHPPPIIRGSNAPESISICCSPPLGWSVATGRRQRTLSLPEGAEVCFFSDGLIEARCAESGNDMLLGRERLRNLLNMLGPRPDAGKLLHAIRAAAIATPDDMAVCIMRSGARSYVRPVDTEELEVDESMLAGDPVRDLLAAYGSSSKEIENIIGAATSIAAECETAILLIEHGRNAIRVTVAQPVELAPAANNAEPRLATGPALVPALRAPSL